MKNGNKINNSVTKLGMAETVVYVTEITLLMADTKSALAKIESVLTSTGPSVTEAGLGLDETWARPGRHLG
jgi:hypothetical protein